MCDRDTVTESQCYKILQVDKDSSFENIRHAYIDLAWQCQKQLIAGNEANRKQAEENFKSINRAYEQLKSRFQTFIFPAAGKNKQDVGVRKTNPEFWYQKGVLQDQLGEKEEAIRSFPRRLG